jgi:hypothetical protein
MKVDLLTGMNKCTNDPSRPNSSDIQRLIPSRVPPSLLDFAQAHESTYSKIKFAEYHLFILQQMYNSQREPDTQHWARAEMHSIVSNLYSALDSLGYEINLAYRFGLGAGEIHIHHNHKKFEPKCLRCRINKENDNVTSYLNTSLCQHWFTTFNHLRNQITHRNIPVLQIVISGGIFKMKIPNDPTDNNPDPINGYSDNLDLKQYCDDIKKEVVKVTEDAYYKIKQRIKNQYNI